MILKPASMNLELDMQVIDEKDMEILFNAQLKDEPIEVDINGHFLMFDVAKLSYSTTFDDKPLLNARLYYTNRKR